MHAGAGALHYQALFGSEDFSTNLIFLHRGIIPPKSGIGHHFHNHMEEMFVIFDNEAEFTIDGRTSRLIGPAAAPCRMGHSHGIYNPTDRPTEWMNIAVGSIKGKYDNFDLGDDRAGAPVEAKAPFITMHLDRKLLKPATGLYGGKGTVAISPRPATGGVFHQLVIHRPFAIAARNLGWQKAARRCRGDLLRDVR